MSTTSADRRRGATRTKVDRTNGPRRLLVPDVARVAIPQPAGSPVAPAAHAAVIEDRARVIVPHAYRLGGAPRAEVHRPDRSGCLIITDRAGVPVPKLTLAAVAPATHAAVADDRAGVISAGVEAAGRRRRRLRRLLRPRESGKSAHQHPCQQHHARAQNNPSAKSTGGRPSAPGCRHASHRARRTPPLCAGEYQSLLKVVGLDAVVGCYASAGTSAGASSSGRYMLSAGNIGKPCAAAV